MTSRSFLIFPCGKKVELKIPLSVIKDDKVISILPSMDEYFAEAKTRYEVNGLKVEMLEIENYKPQSGINDFISIVKKISIY